VDSSLRHAHRFAAPRPTVATLTALPPDYPGGGREKRKEEEGGSEEERTRRASIRVWGLGFRV
jgi:hypothetical protein